MESEITDLKNTIIKLNEELIDVKEQNDDYEKLDKKRKELLAKRNAEPRKSRRTKRSQQNVSSPMSDASSIPMTPDSSTVLTPKSEQKDENSPTPIFETPPKKRKLFYFKKSLIQTTQRRKVKKRRKRCQEKTS
eukprot:UN22588